LVGEQGTGSSSPFQQQAGLAALRTCMAEAPDALMQPLHAWLQAQVQRTDHDALSPGDIAKWAAPEGMLAAEVGAQNGFVAEVVEDKNVRKVPPEGLSAGWTAVLLQFPKPIAYNRMFYCVKCLPK
jgi:hypothetical protein